MPVYVYKGLETGNYYEFEQGFWDEPLRAHPETGEPLKRVITPPAILFKGSGWHVKDYAKKEGGGKGAGSAGQGSEE
ncbi:FmdB family zinc ribbon protein [Thermus thermamylovorans]|uniref:FmdB family transcriptional regulator n=1 Tax=Thermus thermamylovorans TaxID=2509362 RepID=A0A4Q9AZS9_9DEIN|nr:FmdB family transcriptional regulator [Thermus thermamylovorans]TBH17467.1 FmdB family transcriptional regulator [Thermus thermamylovorans]